MVGRRYPDANLTIRVDPDVVLWARVRALQRGTSISAVIRRSLEAYAGIPEDWKAGLPPPWEHVPAPDGPLAPEDE
jgi:hypothetical protein